MQLVDSMQLRIVCSAARYDQLFYMKYEFWLMTVSTVAV